MKFIYKLSIILILISSNAFAVNVATGNFIPPTERDDGTAMAASEIAGYNMFVDGVPDALSPLPATAVSFTTSPLSGGDHVISIQTIDTGGRTSKARYEVAATVPFADPNPPQGDGTAAVIDVP